MYMDYVLIGWQEDDLPLFGLIEDILVLNGRTAFKVIKYLTSEIDRHYHSFHIKKTSDRDFCWLSKLVDHHTFQGHVLLNSKLYITFRSHIE